MPRSQNRRTIEVSVPLYEELKARAEQEGLTIPAVLQGLHRWEEHAGVVRADRLPARRGPPGGSGAARAASDRE